MYNRKTKYQTYNALKNTIFCHILLEKILFNTIEINHKEKETNRNDQTNFPFSYHDETTLNISNLLKCFLRNSRRIQQHIITD